jgi:ATP-dependent Lon protease
MKSGNKTTKMYLGLWKENTKYNRGDIVYAQKHWCYFVCSIDHIADNITYPSEDDIHWIFIDDDFLQIHQDPGILFSNKKNSGKRARSESDTIGCITETENNPTSPIITLARQPPSRDSIEETRQRTSMKRKLQKEETTIKEYKKRKTDANVEDLREQLLLLDVDVATKAFIVDKYDNLQMMSGSDQSKGLTWLKTVADLPYGKNKPMKVKNGDKPEQIEAFFNHVKHVLDKSICGLEDVKQEILEFVARKISNPEGKGEVLALCGSAGCGKTRLLKSLAEALDLPFFQINCGGLNDVAVIKGHSETYTGSKPGKIVEFLQSSQYMNPIIYLDEIDKISERKSDEINGILTHLLDEEQNNNFQDVYLSNIPIDLSKVLFVIAFNDISKIDSIVSDRMKIIYVDKPSLKDKVTICTEKLIPEIISNINKDITININKEIVEYIVLHKCDKEVGVRQLRKTLEKVINRMNFDILTRKVPQHCMETIICEEEDKKNIVYNVTKRYVDNVINTPKEDNGFLNMYI